MKTRSGLNTRCLTVLLLLLSFSLKAQLNLTLNVLPPYSPYISDYVTFQNKALLTVINTSGAPVSFYLKASIIGDNGISGTTRAGFKPASALVINGPTATFKGMDFDGYFNEGNFKITGIAVADVVKGAGLPEGNYRICMQAFDWNTNTEISPEVCANLNIIYPEAPIPVMPICGATAVSNDAQTVTFSWTPPPGTTGMQYVLRMTPVPANGDPNNAMNTITEPPFYQSFTPLTTTSYTYRTSDPKLTKGVTYAWQVTAIDPNGRYLVRNNGRSPVCYFQYGDTSAAPVLSSVNADSLIVTNPRCRYFKDANGVNRIDSNVAEADGNKLVYSDSRDLSLTWIWNKQIAGNLSDKVTTANGGTIFGYKVIFEPLNQVGEKRTATKGDKRFTREAITTQYLNLSASDIAKAGLLPDHWYQISIQALGNGGTGPTGVRTLAEVRSCDVRLLKEVDSDKMVRFSGTLVYRLEDGGALYPVNNVKLSLKLSSKKDKAGSSKIPSSFSAEPGFPASTDAKGQFSVLIPVPKDRANFGFLSVDILNPYYRSMDTCLTISLKATLGKDSAGKLSGADGNSGVLRLKDNVELGQVPVDALTYSLKVEVGKGFPKFYYDTLSASISVKGDQYVIDTTTIKPRVRVKAGIPVVIYRYAKAADVPFQEGDNEVRAAVRGKQMLQVAEGVTSIEDAGSPKEKTVVLFKRLLCNMRQDEEYYIKAMLPGTNRNSSAAKNPFQTRTDKAPDVYALTADEDLDAFLEAPEQLFQFKPSPFQLQQFKNHFSVTTTYNLISTLPPMSTVSGKMVYTWPGKDVQRPLAKAPFVVRMVYTFNGKEGFPQGEVDGNKYCFAKTQVMVNGKPQNGVIQENEEVLYSDMDGVVLGTGTTDDQGNFKINFINYDKKGSISTDAHLVTAKYPCPPENKTAEKDPKIIDPISQKKLGYDDDWSFGANQSDIYQKHGSEKSGYGMGGGFGYTGGTQFISEHGISATGAGNATNSSVNGGLNKGGLDLGGKGMSKGIGFKAPGGFDFGASYAYSEGSIGHGPSSSPASEIKTTANTVVGESAITVGRMLVIELTGPHTSFYGNRMSGGSLDNQSHFVLQAFDKTDLGTLSTKVINTKSTTKVEFQKKNDKGAWVKCDLKTASGIKMTIYRPKGGKPALTPLGEGTANHPMKPLLRSSVLDDSPAEQMEWVIDTSFSMNGQNQFLVSDLHSIAAAGKCKIQIAPNPEADLATLFEPIQGVPLGGVHQLYLQDGKIVGRVTEAGSDKGIKAQVSLACVGCKKTGVSGIDLGMTLTTDDQGYFEYSRGQVLNGRSYDWDQEKNEGLPDVTCYAFKDGYNTVQSKTLKAPMLGQQRRYDLQIQPGCKISGIVRGEGATKINAYIMRLPDTTLLPTPKNGSAFELYAPSATTIQLKIISQDPAYFDSVITVKTPPSGPVDLKYIDLPKRLHRMQFDITLANADGALSIGKEIEAGLFKVTINADSALSKSNTLNSRSVSFAFANVSVNNYSVSIIDAKGRGYIPQVLNVSNKESRGVQVYKVTMRLGDSLSGKVTRTGNFAVKNARVYLEQSSGSSQTDPKDTAWNAIETTTDADGRYVLRGIPRLPKIRVHATVQAFGVLIEGGDTSLSIKNGGAVANFFLKDLVQADLSNVYGFPFAVESAKSFDGDKFKVTGVVNLSANQTKLSWLDAKTKVRIEDVVFVQRTVSGKKVLQPAAEVVTLSEAGLKMKLAGRYNLAISGLDQMTKTTVNGKPVSIGTSKPLQLSKDGEGGTVFARARIVDNSYNYPSTYLNFDNSGEFHLANWNSGDQKMRLDVPVISTLKKTEQYQLSDKSGDSLQFSFIGFDAKAGPKMSFIDNSGKIHLNVNFRGQAGNCQPGYVDVAIKELILDQNKIDAASFSDPLHLKLENWDLEVKNWSVDPTKGGLYSENAVIHTGIADIPMGLFNLRHDLFVLQNPKLESLTLGGGLIPLYGIDPTKASLVYDQKTGSDLGAHWRLSVSSNGAKPAARFDLQTEYDKTTLTLDYFQMISYNNENIISLRKDVELPIANNGRIHYYPDGIATNPGYFVLNGTATFDVPRTPTTVIGIRYSKNGSFLKQDIAPFSFSFDGKGYTRFTASADGKPAELDPKTGMARLYGIIEEPGKTDKIPCMLSFGKKGSIDSAGMIYLQPKNETIKLTQRDNLKLVSTYDSKNALRNGMRVENKDWTNLRFSGFITPNDPAAKVTKDNYPVNFEVLGEITANTEKVEVSDIKTPFGTLNMVYDFKESTMRGAMRMDDVEFGSYKFTGDVQVEFGKKGFLTMAAGQLNTGTLLAEGFGTFSSGLVLGAYDQLSDDIIAKTVQFSKDPKSACWINERKTNFKGFYFTGGYDILNTTKGFDIGIASAYFNAVLGVECALGMSFGKGTEGMLNVGAHGSVMAGLSAVTGTSISGYIEGHLTAAATYSNAPGAGFGVHGASALGFSCRACQSIPFFDDICFDFEKACGATFGFAKGKGSYFDFQLGSIADLNKCGGTNKTGK